MQTKTKIQELTTIALLTTLLSVSAYIIIPLPFTTANITAQTLIVNLIGLILTPLQAACAVGTWILIGLVGIPVFSGGTGGPWMLVGPTGGYIWGMLAAAILISLLKGPNPTYRRSLFVTIGAGIPVIYLFGSIVMKLVTGLGWQALLVSSVIPFIPLDIAKCAAAAYLAIPLRKYVIKSRRVYQ